MRSTLAHALVALGGIAAGSACTDTIAPSGPTIAIASPVSGTTNLTGTLTLRATASASAGVSQVEFEVDGAVVGTDATDPYEATIVTADYASGVHVIRVRAQDAGSVWSDQISSVVTFGGTVALPAGFTRAPFVSGFGSRVTAATLAPDGRMFVAEQGGALRVVSAGALLPTPFVSLAVLSEGERGLLGVALDPAFATNGFVYVYYTTAAGGAHNRISRFTASGNVAAGPETILADLPPLTTATNHNGGALAFGPDGRLYVAVGDNTQPLAPQSVASPLGKILRFNADGSIPTDNPFYTTTTGQARAIWALGLRNPYTFAFHPTTGRMFINDVGQSAWEEINLGRAGANYGWPNTEGPTTAAGIDAPFFAYAHTNSPTLFQGGAIVGGAFYTPATPTFGADYVGDYFFADFVAGTIHRIEATRNDGAYSFARLGASPAGLLLGSTGSLYVFLGTAIDVISR